MYKLKKWFVILQFKYTRVHNCISRNNLSFAINRLLSDRLQLHNVRVLEVWVIKQKS